MNTVSPLSEVPRSGPEREALREKGQFWTPAWVAEAMAAYVLQDEPASILDPAMGGGALLMASKRLAQSRGFDLALFGRDIDPAAIPLSKLAGLSPGDLANMEIRDFLLDPPPRQFPAIIVNPPYIRHHRLLPAQKRLLSEYAQSATGRRIDGRAGLHVYFLIRSLQTLAPGGRLAFIVSADICEGVFADALWRWVCSTYRIDAVVTFAPESAPFPSLDTNALIFCIQHSPPAESFDWVECREQAPEALAAIIAHRNTPAASQNTVRRRRVREALQTGFSRPPSDEPASQYVLGDFAKVMRGLVTGDNGFFFMTAARANRLGIPETLLIKAIGRTRDVPEARIDDSDIERLETLGRPTRLLYVNGTPFEQLPSTVQDYLRIGEMNGLPQKTLIQTRKPWYKMENRQAPPILFAYLGRRSSRFIRNRANVVPLTSFLCVYPKQPEPSFEEMLWDILDHPDTVANLSKVGKSYGGGAVKVEPRALERLPLPDHLISATGLGALAEQRQGSLDLFDQ